jgi:hypothetical protein
MTGMPQRAIVIASMWVAMQVCTGAHQVPGNQRNVQSAGTALDIDWAAARRAEPQSRSDAHRRFVGANRKAIDQVRVPVLLPAEADLMAGPLRLFPNRDVYTLSSRAGDMAFVLSGSARAFPLSSASANSLPKGGLKARVPSDGILIEHTERGIDASFTRFGAAYAISLECADVTDARCSADTYIRSVIDRLTVVVPAQNR